MTANETFDLLEEEEKGQYDVADEVDVALFPPTESADAQTDADSDASDEPAGFASHLPRRLLAAGAEMALSEDGEAVAAEDPGVRAAPYNEPPSTKQGKRTKPLRRWHEGRAKTKSVPGFAATHAQNAETLLQEQCNSANEFFRLFLDDQFLDLFIMQTTLYASQHYVTDWETDRDKLMAFFGILLLSGYARLPHRRL